MAALFESSEDRGDGLAAPDASAEDAPSAGRDLLNEGSLKNERDALAGAGAPTGRGGLTGRDLLSEGSWRDMPLRPCANQVPESVNEGCLGGACFWGSGSQ